VRYPELENLERQKVDSLVGLKRGSMVWGEMIAKGYEVLLGVMKMF
jgi:hypothetical protein